MSIAERLEENGIILPVPGAPIAAYVPAVRTGNLLFVSGQLPRSSGALLFPGKLGDNVTVEQGQAAARACVVNALAAIQQAMGSLDAVRQVVRLNGYVACVPAFDGQSKIIDGASSLLQSIFGDAGRHSRVAIGVAALPLNASVELDLIVEVGDLVSP